MSTTSPRRFAADCTIVRHGSPELVELAEAKLAGEEVGVDAVRAAAQPMFDAPGGERIDTVVLACTHFPLLEDELRAAFPDVAYVDGGPGIARRIAYLTRDQPWPAQPAGRHDASSPATRVRPPLDSALARFGLGRNPVTSELLQVVRNGIGAERGAKGRPSEAAPLDYDRIFKSAIERLHDEGRYRVFIDILRTKGSFPNAHCFGGNGPKPITVWCSNDYLGMGQHPAVVEAMETALHEVGAGSGGTRNISGNTHYHTELEAELAEPPRQGRRAALHLRLRVERGGAVDARQAAARLRHLLGRAQPRLDDRRDQEFAAARSACSATTTSSISRSCSRPRIRTRPS